MSRYSQEQAHRIFARAAARQHTAAAPDGDLSLAELQAIGREAGIDPAHIAAAAAEADAPQGPTWFGHALRNRAVRRLDTPADDAAWGRVVGHFLDDPALTGTAEEIGDRRVWTAASGARVTLAPDDDGAVLTVDSPRASQDIILYVYSAMGAFLGGIGLLAHLVKGKDGGLWMVAIGIALTLATALWASLSIRRRSRQEPARTDRLADTLARIADPSASAALDARLDTAPRSPALDLDALGPTPEAGRSANRARTQ
ncbi:hypothetical protein [Rubrivirga sp. IMCC43871]|uniref:hypothetical protein n=1 Tax=Rubrivirga sp. IMCC43871 TaxID=3391575 RepID=UPI00399027B2